MVDLCVGQGGPRFGSDLDASASFHFQSDRFFDPDFETRGALPVNPPPKSGTFTLPLSNNTPSSTHDTLTLRVNTSPKIRSVFSVPEPETIALMLAGLGTVATTRLRQRM